MKIPKSKDQMSSKVLESTKNADQNPFRKSFELLMEEHFGITIIYTEIFLWFTSRVKKYAKSWNLDRTQILTV